MIIEKITKQLAFFTVLLIYFGYCNLDFYYSWFGIAIYGYATNAELILNFLPMSPYIIIFVLFVGIEMVILNEHEHKKQNRVALVENEKVNSKKRFIGSFGFIFILLSIVAILSAALIYFFHRKLYDFKFEIFTLLFCTYVYVAIKTAGPLTRLANDKDFRKTHALGILTFFWLLGVLAIENRLSVDKLKDGKPKYSVEFLNENVQITTDSLNMYVGETQNYLFLYNLKDKQTSIYRKDNIKNYKISLK
jgi:hypothetical protein